MKNVLWGAAALAILVLSFTLPLGDFRLSLNHVGRVSKPITQASFVGTSRENNCFNLKFELQSRALSLSEFWLGFAVLSLVFGLAAFALLQKDSDRILLIMGLVVSLATLAWLVYSFGQHQRQIGAGQVLYSSYCVGAKNP